MTAKERWQEYASSTYGVPVTISAAMSAGFSQAINSPQEWGQGARGYGLRLGQNVATTIIRGTLTYGASSALREDNRYYSSHLTTFKGRLGYVFQSLVLARSNDGSRHVSASRLGGALGTSVLTRVWTPPSWQGAANIAQDFGIWAATEVGVDFGKEFYPEISGWLKSHLTKKKQP
jgi:hypothetical protein